MTVSERLAAALSDRYRIERELGAGGMATVYLAQDLKHDRQVAVKVLKPELGAVLGAERFLAEIKVTANLRHPHILPLYDSGAADEVLFYVMPFVDGESLRDRLDREKQLPLDDALRIAREVADALSYAHARGVIHRDIKPENILLESGHAVVADFGIAKAVRAAGGQALTQTGMSVGTPSYMSPEQAAGEQDLDGRSDLYALACVLYEMLAGQPPFTGATAEVLVRQHLTVDPPPVTNYRPAVPAAVAAALQRALAKAPADRFNPVAQFSEALRFGESGTPAAGIAAPLPTRRFPSRAAISLAGALVLTAIVLLAVWRRGSGPPAARASPGSPKSLAVLPFESVGGDTANAYFAEGIGDELTTALAQLPGLRVAGRSSASRFKGKGASAKEVGSALGVGSVLDGTVRRAGGRVRITAQLTSASDGLVLWSESYDREAKDVFALQDDITQAIVAALQVRLAAGTTEATSGAGTTNLEAYDLYLRGLYLYRRRGTELLRAAELLEQAIAKDSLFARAHAALATVLLTEPYYLPVRMGETIPRARAIAQRAVALDPNLSEAHQALGIAYNGTFEWEAAEREERKAIALEPSSAEAQYRLGFLLVTTGRITEAIQELERGKALDPLYPLTAGYLGYAEALAGHLDAAVAESRRAVELDSTNLATRTLLAYVYGAAGRSADRLAIARRVIAETDDPRRLGTAAFSLGQLGDPSGSRAIGAKLEAMPADAPGRNSGLAYVYLGLGDTARALTAMERAGAAAGGDLLFAIVPSDPTFDAVRGSPRFAAVLRRFNLDVARLTAPRGGRPQ